MFLKAFAPETDRSIVKEIEAAQAKVAKKLDQTEEVSAQAVEEILAHEKEEAVALAELRVRLAIVNVKESESEKVGECKTFQLPSTNTHFVGREEALAEVVRQLDQANSSVIGQSISGIGGVGKTQLAIHFAQAAANGESVGGRHLSYDYVLWLNAELFLEGQFQAIAEVWIGKHLNGAEAIEAVYQYLKGKRTLLVFDNAENARSITACLPPAQHASPVHFLITSRSAQWGELPTVKLRGFSLEEAQEYVEYHLGPQSKDAIAKLVELLGGLPLAMSQVVSYIKAGHSTLEGFEEQYHLNQASLLSHELLEEEDHPKTVGTTLTLSLAQAKVKSPIAEKLLGILAYFAPTGQKIEFLVSLILGFEKLSISELRLASKTSTEELLADAVEDSKEELSKAIEVLENYSLISHEGCDIRIHRLVQEVMLHRHKFLLEPQRYWKNVIELLDTIIVDDDRDSKKAKQYSFLMEHVQQLAKLSQWLNLSKEEQLLLAALLAKSGIHQTAIGNYKIAQAFQEKALEIIERHYGFDNIEVATTLFNLGNTYGNLGNAYKKKELLERAFTIFERHHGSNNIRTATTLGQIGVAYGNLGDNYKKKELLKRALIIQELHYGPNDAQVAETLVNLGNAYFALENVTKARKLLERALIIQFRYCGSNYVGAARTLNNLGNIYGVLGDLVKKKNFLEAALAIFKSHFGPDHVQVAMILANLASACLSLGEILEAKEYAQKTYLIFKEYYTESHSNTQQAKELLQMCERQLSEEVFMRKTSNPIRTTASATVDSENKVENSKPLLVREKLLEAVTEWVRVMKEAIEAQQTKVYESKSERIYVSKALVAIKDGYWDKLLESPSRYGIPRELVSSLEKYREAHPILANAVGEWAFVMEVCKRLETESEIGNEKTEKPESILRNDSKGEEAKSAYRDSGVEIGGNRAFHGASSSVRDSVENLGDGNSLHKKAAGEMTGLISKPRAEETSSCIKCIVS